MPYETVDERGLPMFVYEYKWNRVHEKAALDEHYSPDFPTISVSFTDSTGPGVFCLVHGDDHHDLYYVVDPETEEVLGLYIELPMIVEGER